MKYSTWQTCSNKHLFGFAIGLCLITALSGYKTYPHTIEPTKQKSSAFTEQSTTTSDSRPSANTDSSGTKTTFKIDRNGGFSYKTESLQLSSDNGNIYSVLYIPESGATIYPAVIFSHGFGDTNRGGQTYAQALASQGYLAVCFDFRGGGPSSQSDGSPLNMTIFSEQEDLEAEITMLRERSDVDDQFIFLLGNSQGGVVSSLAAAHPEWIRAMALSSPAFSLGIWRGNPKKQSVHK